MILQKGLLEHYDYVAVSRDVWKCLFAWYGCDWSIIKELKLNQKRLYLDLYDISDDN